MVNISLSIKKKVTTILSASFSLKQHLVLWPKFVGNVITLSNFLFYIQALKSKFFNLLDYLNKLFWISPYHNKFPFLTPFNKNNFKYCCLWVFSLKFNGWPKHKVVLTITLLDIFTMRVRLEEKNHWCKWKSLTNSINSRPF